MLNRSQLISVNPDFVCITQPDGEETPPFPIPKCQVASFGIPNTKKGPDVITQTQEDDHDGSESISVGDISDDDPEKVASVPTFSSRDNSRNWLKRRGAREKARTQFRKKFAKKMTKEERKLSKLKSGVTVWCRHESVADFHPDDKPRKGHRRVRVKEEGTLLKKSSYYKECYVVAFDKGFSSTVHFKHLHFVRGTSKTHRFVRGSDGKLVLERFDRNAEEENAILRFILNSKIFRTIGHDDVTYDYLVQLFRPRYAWLTSSKLRKYVSKSRSSLRANTANVPPPKPGTWLANLPVEETHASNEILEALRDTNRNDSDDDFRPVRNFQQNSHKKAVNNQDNNDFSSNNPSVARGSHAVDGNNHNSNSYDYDNDTSEVEADDEKENHGLACTCCGIHFKSVVTDSDMKQIKMAKLFHISDFMITKITKGPNNSRSVAMKMISSGKKSEHDRRYTNVLNKQLDIPRRYDINDRLIEDEEEIKKFDIEHNIVLKPKTNFYDDSSSAKSSSDDDENGSDTNTKVDCRCDDVKKMSCDSDVCIDVTKPKNNKKMIDEVNVNDCNVDECNDDEDEMIGSTNTLQNDDVDINETSDVMVDSVDITRVYNDDTRIDSGDDVVVGEKTVTSNDDGNSIRNDEMIVYTNTKQSVDIADEESSIVNVIDGTVVGNVNGMMGFCNDEDSNFNDGTSDGELVGMVGKKCQSNDVECSMNDDDNVDVCDVKETATIVDPKVFSLSESLPCYTSTSKSDSVYDQYPEVQEYLGTSK